MLFLLLKLLSLALVALLVLPVKISAAVYLSLDRKLALVGVNVFGVTVARISAALSAEGLAVTINGKKPKKTYKMLNLSKYKNKISAIKLTDLKFALQLGGEDAVQTALIVQSARNIFNAVEATVPSSDLHVFADWENEVFNAGLRIDLDIIPLKLISG
jgi:hypothetical protein